MNVQRPLNSSYNKARAEQAASRSHVTEEHERQAIFLREHRAKIAEWGPVTPYGLPAPAPEPIQQPKSKSKSSKSPDDNSKA